MAGTAGEAGAEHGPLGPIEVVLLLFVAATVLAIVARRIGIPYPILLVLGGLAIGFVPGLPAVELDPELVFLLFLPPILFAAGYFTSIADLKANLRAISLLAVGLVLFTTVVVGVVAKALIPEMPWPVAFALGAIVAPPDAVAATAIFERLGVPRRIVTILEGESLVNDATALVAYRFAVVAAVTGAFSLVNAGITLLFVAVAGIAFGLVVGWLTARVVRRVDDPVFSVVITFLAPAAAYIPAEQLGASGVLAAVAAGIFVGRTAPQNMGSEVRVAGAAAWQVLLFLINGAVFILIGLQLPAVLEGLEGRSAGELLGLGAAVSVAAILARIVWVFPGTYLPRRLSAGIREREPYPRPRAVFLVSWAGMRGVVSLAAALGLPLTLATGEPFPERNLVIFLTFAVILATLVGQGLTLPLLIRRLGLVPDGDGGEGEAQARLVLTEAAIDRLGQLEARGSTHGELLDRLRAEYLHKAEHLNEPERSGPTDAAEQERIEHREILRSVLDAEREALLRLRDRGGVSDEAFRRLERNLDLAELRMDV